jgi:hypothetical protein
MRTISKRFWTLVFFSAVTWLSLPIGVFAQWKDDVGWTALNSVIPSLEDGSDVVVSQVEAPVNNAYMPNTNHSQLVGRTYIDGSGTGVGFSNHATNVALYFYGDPASIAFGVPEITCYDANHWINIVTGYSGSQNPMLQPFEVQNHSWIATGSGIPNAAAENASKRIDYMIQESNLNMVCGTDNSGSTPKLLAHCYNNITVGLTDGTHATGYTYLYGNGRVKPEIVAPHLNSQGMSQTSFSTPMVASGAAVLRDAALCTSGEKSEAIKAMLLAGATKKEFPNWQNTILQPLDFEFGAGELNIYNSYQILQGGETDGTTEEPSDFAPLRGWDYGDIAASSDLYYNVEVSDEADEASIFLVWNIDVVDTNANKNLFTPSASLPGLNLILYDSSDGFLDTLVAQSSSSVDNLEHIYLRDLPAGIYTIRVAAADATDFALAWRFSTEERIVPDSFTALRGFFLGGDLSSLAQSDNNYLKYRPGITLFDTEPPIWIEFETTTTFPAPNGIQLQLESRADTANILQTIELYSFQDEEYTVIDSQLTSLGSDATATIDLTGELLDFVEQGTGKIRARVGWDSNGIIFLFPWTICVDMVSWDVAE